MASKSLLSNLNSNKANILNLNDNPFSKKSIYYNYYGKNEFTEDNTISIFANLVDSTLDNANIIGKIFYVTIKYSDTHIFTQLIVNTDQGNINAVNIEDNNIRDNYKHAYKYNILSSTGIYTNARSMELVKHPGDHAPREWVIM